MMGVYMKSDVCKRIKRSHDGHESVRQTYDPRGDDAPYRDDDEVAEQEVEDRKAVFIFSMGLLAVVVVAIVYGLLVRGVHP